MDRGIKMGSDGLGMIFTILGAAGVSLAGVLLLLEGILRCTSFVEKKFFTRYVTRKDFLAEGYQPYIRWVEDWSKPIFQYIPIGIRHFNLDNPIPGRVRNNSLGFRCDEFGSPDPEVLRVVILGGSAAWGSGASSNEATIASQLEKLINSDGKLPGSYKRAKCYNLAQVNGNQTQDILTLIFFASRIKPDLALSFTGWNELVTSITMRQDYLEKYGVFYMDEMEGWEPLNVVGNKTKLLKNALIMWGSENFELIKRLNLLERPESSAAGASRIERIELGSRLFLNHLMTIQKLAKGFDFQHFQFMQPYLYRKKNLTSQETQVVNLYDHVRPVHGGKTTGDYLREHNIYLPLLAAIDGISESIGPVIDLCDIFRDEKEPMFYTLVHLRDEGYLKIAERMYETLLHWFSRKD